MPGARHDSTDIERLTTSPDGPVVVSEGEQDVNRRNSMATVKTSDVPQTIATEANGRVSSSTEVVKLDITDPTFMATAYDTYDALREKPDRLLKRCATSSPIWSSHVSNP